MVQTAFLPNVPCGPFSSCSATRTKQALLRNGKTSRWTHLKTVCTQHGHAAASDSPPAIGLVPNAGTTGSCAANLWPIPILADYGWTLVVWKRKDLVGYSTGIRVNNTKQATRLFVSVVPRPLVSDPSQSTATFGANVGSSIDGSTKLTISGILTGNYNVATALQQLKASPTDQYDIAFLDNPDSNFLNLQSTVSLPRLETGQTDHALHPFWSSFAHKYQRQQTINPPDGNKFDIRMVFEPRHVPSFESKFQYFAMALDPIPILGPYSCLVAVNKQSTVDSSWVAFDKLERNAQLSLLEWTKLDDSFKIPDDCVPMGRIAVKEFQGAITDQRATQMYNALIQSILDAGYTPAFPHSYRILMDNKPGCPMTGRRSELIILLKD